MEGRKIDYFGTFLENMKSPAPLSQNATPARAAKPAAAGPDSLNDVLKSLRGGARGAKDLIPLTGNSASEFLAVRNQLVALGWASLVDGDALELTPKGDEVASVLA